MVFAQAGQNNQGQVGGTPTPAVSMIESFLFVRSFVRSFDALRLLPAIERIGFI